MPDAGVPADRDASWRKRLKLAGHIDSEHVVSGRDARELKPSGGVGDCCQRNARRQQRDAQMCERWPRLHKLSRVDVNEAITRQAAGPRACEGLADVPQWFCRLLEARGPATLVCPPPPACVL